MHYIKQPSLARSLLTGSFFFILAALSLVFAIAALVRLLIWKPEDGLMVFGVAVAVAIFLWVVRWFSSERCRCQLCQANLLQSLRCSRNGEARRLFGSYRLRLACAILLLRRFRCFYCGEEFNLRVPDLPPEAPAAPPRRVVSMRKSGSLPTKKR